MRGASRSAVDMGTLPYRIFSPHTPIALRSCVILQDFVHLYADAATVEFQRSAGARCVFLYPLWAFSIVVIVVETEGGGVTHVVVGTVLTGHTSPSVDPTSPRSVVRMGRIIVEAWLLLLSTVHICAA